MKPIKKKKCIECSTEFLPFNSLQKVCGNKCAIIVGKSEQKKKKAKEWQKEKSILKEKLKTKSDYEKDLQILINKIVRLIDKNTCCISTGKPLNEKFDAGHFFSVGSNPTIRFNLLNIYAQSVYANQYLSGDQINFMNGLSDNYGKGLQSIVLKLKSDYKVIKLSIDDLKEKIVIAKSIVKHLEIENKTYNSIERIELRKKYNNLIGIY